MYMVLKFRMSKVFQYESAYTPTPNLHNDNEPKLS